MQRKTRWIAGTAVAGALLIGTSVASAQTTPPSGWPGAGACPGPSMMAGARGPAAVGAYGPGVVHDAIATALGVTPQELWDARAAGKTVAALATEKQVPLQTVVDAALAAHTAQLAAAVNAGTLSQAQANAMQQLMRSRIEQQFQTGIGMGGLGRGVMSGGGMMGGFGFGPGRRPAP